MEEKNRKNAFHRWEILLFVVYLTILCYLLFFADSMGRTYAERTYHYNLVPFREIRRFWIYRETLGTWFVTLNLVGNVVAFLPFGVFLPRLFAKCRRFWATMLFSFEFSLFVELIQLVSKVGCFDVDDILLNTLGGVLGYCIYRVYHCLSGKKECM